MKEDDSKAMYFATRKYKDWVLAEFKKRDWSYKEFAAEVTRRGFKCSAQGLEQFLAGPPSSTSLMPGINRAIGLPVPKHFDPTTPLSRLHLAIDANWDRIPEKIQQALALTIAGHDPAEK